MLRFMIASITGWAAVLGTGIESALPYIVRGTPAQTNRRNRMWPHYWLGYALSAAILAHTWMVSGPAMGRSDVLGIWAATLALCLLFLQVGLGLILKSGSGQQRQLRRWHFWSMVAFVGLLVIHIVRNG